MAIFENINPFNKDANFSSIRIGADAPVLEVELNEMQLIQRERLRSTAKALLNEGVKGMGSYSYSNNLLTITNELVMLDGEVLNIPSATVSVREGEEVYVEVWEEEKTFLDNIFKHGSSHTTEKVPNYLLDGRIGEETSRRIQVRYRITTTPTQETKLLLGYVEHGNFILLANNLNARITPYGNGMDFTVYQHFTLVSPLGKKFKLKSTYEGELYTEPSTDTFIGLPIILEDPTNKTWMITVDEEGRLTTVRTSKPTLNVQYTEPSTDTFIGLPIILEDPTNKTWMITVDEEGRLTTVRTSKPTLNVHHYLQTPPPFGIIYKLEVTVEGELRVASVCEVNIINDEVTTLDKTWSSHKLNQHVLAQDKVVNDLAEEQLRVASVCEVNIINDEVTTLDKTWSSHKLNQHVLAQDKVVNDLAEEQTEFLQEVIRQKDELIETLVNEQSRLVETFTKEKNDLLQLFTTEKNDLIAGMEESSDYIIKYTQAMVNEVLGMHTVINSPNGLVFQITVDEEGVLGTLQKEVVINE